MKNKVLLVALISVFALAEAQVSKSDLLSDIDELEALIRQKHVSPFWLNTEENVTEVMAQAKASIENRAICDEACLVELMKIIAAIQDGHSTMSGDSRYDLFGYLPLSTRWFDGELRVMRTTNANKAALGAKVLAINDMPIGQVLEKLKTVVPQANEYRFQKFAGSYLHLPGLLYGLGITKDPKQAQFTFQNEKLSFDLMLKNLTPEEESKADFVGFLDNKKELPLYQRNNADYYWFDFDPDTGIFYFQYNRVGNMEEERSSAFAQRMWSEVDSVQVDKFILDLRYNGGGNFPFSLRFIQGLLDRITINQRGKLFIITGYDTFSAAMDMLNELELRSKAIIVGEYPCDRPSRPGDPESYELSKSGIKVNLSSLYHPTAILDDQRITNSLDKEIITSWKDYSLGRDPVMEYIQGYYNTELTPVSAQSLEEFIGVYSYSPTRNIRLKREGDEAWLEFSRALNTPLYPGKEGKFRTEIPDLELEILSDKLIIYYPDGRQVEYARTDATKSAVEYFYEGDLVNARKAYRSIKEKYPDFIELQDHMMSFMANTVYFDLLKYPDIEASKIARAILHLGIELNDGNAPFCEYALRFYP